ncbi:TPA: conjugal transfer protein, partial [Enterococcus faecium]
ESEEIKLEAFVKRFFELYVKNDEKLALISNEKGLEGGELINVQLDHAVKNKEGNYFLQGKYRFYFEKGNEFQSNFSMEVKTSGDSYFVTTLNE